MAAIAAYRHQNGMSSRLSAVSRAAILPPSSSSARAAAAAAEQDREEMDAVRRDERRTPLAELFHQRTPEEQDEMVQEVLRLRLKQGDRKLTFDTDQGRAVHWYRFSEVRRAETSNKTFINFKAHWNGGCGQNHDNEAV